MSRRYGVENIFISGLLPTTRVTDVIEKVNELLKDICEVESCFYVSIDDITLANFVFNVNTNFLMPCTFHLNKHLTTP